MEYLAFWKLLLHGKKRWLRLRSSIVPCTKFCRKVMHRLDQVLHEQTECSVWWPGRQCIGGRLQGLCPATSKLSEQWRKERFSPWLEDRWKLREIDLWQLSFSLSGMNQRRKCILRTLPKKRPLMFRTIWSQPGMRSFLDMMRTPMNSNW